MSDKLVNFKAPEETVEQAKAKLEYGEMSEKLRRRLDEIAHGADVAEQTRIKDRLKEVREEKRNIEREIDGLRDKRDEKEREIERLEERLDALMEQEGEYDGFLQALETDLHDGEHFFPDHGKIQDAAAKGDCTPEEVISDLKERNPEIPERQFEPKAPNGPGGSVL